MTFNDIKSAVKDFFETLGNTFKQVLKSIKEKLSQDNDENEEELNEQESTKQKEPKNFATENSASKKQSKTKTNDEDKTYSEEYQIKPENSYSTWQAVKSYIPLFADFLTL